MNKITKVTFKLLDLMVIFVMTFSSPMSVLAQDPGPSLTADKSDYAPGESAHINGTGFTPGTYALSAIGPDGSLAAWGEVTADESGAFASSSPALDSEGSYEVRASAGDGTLVASAGFTVSAPPPATESPTTEPTQEPTPNLDPFIQSDKPNYVIGELVTLTGGNWQGDDQVRIFVNDNEGQTWSRDVIVGVLSIRTPNGGEAEVQCGPFDGVLG